MKKMLAFSIFNTILAFSTPLAIASIPLASHGNEDVSSPFIRVAANCSVAVVHIYGEIEHARMRGRPPSSGQNPYELFQDELFERFFGAPSPHHRKPQGSVGSGFFVSDDGYILTNYHVVQQAHNVYVSREGEGVPIQAQLVGFDQKSDIAVLKIDTGGESIPYLPLGDSDNIQVGQWVIAIGSPFELRNTVTTGTVSATHRNNLQLSQIDDFIQVDAAINPGNSGGPLLNLNGEVIGINTAIFSQTGGSIGLGFAVPSNMAKMVFAQIREKGVVDRGFIGIQLQELSPDLAKAFKIPNRMSGVLIADVTPNSAGEKAGLQAGDVIVNVGGKPIASPESLIALISNKTPGDEISVEVYRKGKKQVITVVLGSQAVPGGNMDHFIQRFGLDVELLSPEKAYQNGMRIDDTGMVIMRVLPNSKGAKAGLRSGMIILVANGQKIRSYEDLCEAIKTPQQNKKHVFLVSYKGRASFHCIEE